MIEHGLALFNSRTRHRESELMCVCVAEDTSCEKRACVCRIRKVPPQLTCLP